MSSDDISTLSNEIKTLINSVVDLKNEVEDLKKKNEVLLELKNDIKEIKNLLLSSKNDQLESTTSSVEILKNKTDEGENETAEKKTSSSVINDSNNDSNDNNPYSDNNEKTTDNTGNNNNSNNNSNDSHNDEINESSDNNIINSNNDNYNNDKEINDNNTNECSNNDDNNNNNNEIMNKYNQHISNIGINEPNLIYDQRIMYLTNYFYGSIWNEKKENILQFGQPTGSFTFNQYGGSNSYNSLGNYKTTFYNDAVKVIEDYKKLFCLYIEQKDLSNVIKASYQRMDIDSIVVQNLIDKFILVKDKIKRTREILKSSYSSETVDINYRNKYKNLLDRFKEDVKKELSENKYNFIIDKLNILRLRQLNHNVRYLLFEKDIDNAFKIYDVKDDDFKPIIDELIKNYNDRIYDNEYKINGLCSIHLNRSSFYLSRSQII